MSTEVFIPYKPHAGTLVVVEQANTIIEEYLAQGFALTLRQLFYQFVARALLQNTFKQYKRLGDHRPQCSRWRIDRLGCP